MRQVLDEYSLIYIIQILHNSKNIFKLQMYIISPVRELHMFLTLTPIYCSVVFCCVVPIDIDI